MNNLIEELHKEHSLIIKSLNDAKDKIITTNEGQEALNKAKKIFLQHLKKEDEELYPELKKAALNDPELKQTLNNFIDEMKVVSKDTIYFFDHYSNGGYTEKFAADFARLYIKISRRIKDEENIIYKKYTELVKDD